jgi:oligogalacturonide lyase
MNTILPLCVCAMTSALMAAHAGAQGFPPAKDTRSAANMPMSIELANPPKTWVDAATGHRVVRLTDVPGSASFYFNVNAYTPDGNEMVYTTPEGISVLDLRTLQTRSVVTGSVRTVVVGHLTPSIFYVKTEDNQLYKTNVDSGETKLLGKVPEHGSIATVNADETLAAGTYDDVNKHGAQSGDKGKAKAEGATQTSPLDQPANKGEMMVRRLAARIPLVLYTMDLRNGTVKPLLHSTDWIGHMLFSPGDPSMLMYCHEGPWQAVDRIWTIRTDGTHNELMHTRHMEMEIAGHEFWGQRGDTLYYDLQTPKGEDFFLASLNVDSGERTWYHLERNEWSIHFNVFHDGELFTGDGGDPGQVAKAADGEWIYLYHPEKIRNTGLTEKDFIHPGVLHAEKLVNMSKHNYVLEPNVSFTPNGKMVIFRSNMFGPTYVFGVEVARATPAPYLR